MHLSRAPQPRIDYEINIRSVDAVKRRKKKGFFQRIFSKDDEKNKK